MIPWEREVYLNMLMDYLKEEKEALQHLQREVDRKKTENTTMLISIETKERQVAQHQEELRATSVGEDKAKCTV